MRISLLWLAISVAVSGLFGMVEFVCAGDLYDYRLPSERLRRESIPNEKRASDTGGRYEEFKRSINNLDKKELAKLRVKFAGLQDEARKNGERNRYLYFTNLIYFIDQALGGRPND